MVPPGIGGAEKLTGIFGRWPSFHDAEILTLLFDREASAVGYDLVATIHLWDMTNEVDSSGYFVLLNHTRATFRFYDCNEVRLEDFNQQNVIFDLIFEYEPELPESKEITHRTLSRHLVTFEGCYGLNGTVRCKRVEILEAMLIDPESLKRTNGYGSAEAFSS